MSSLRKGDTTKTNIDNNMMNATGVRRVLLEKEHPRQGRSLLLRHLQRWNISCSPRDTLHWSPIEHLPLWPSLSQPGNYLNAERRRRDLWQPWKECRFNISSYSNLTKFAGLTSSPLTATLQSLQGLHLLLLQQPYKVCRVNIFSSYGNLTKYVGLTSSPLMVTLQSLQG